MEGFNSLRYFNPRTPRGGATFSTTFATGAYWYFNPRTPRGGATVPPNNSGTFPAFQSTHPTRGCDFGCFHWLFSPQFQSTHPTRGCDGINNGWARSILISIHAPHEGVRHVQRAVQLTYNNFNPRTPRGGATAICCSLISRVTTCCRPNITSLLDVVRFLNYCTNLLLFLGEPARVFRTASGSPMPLHY